MRIHRLALLGALAGFAVYATHFYGRQNSGLQPGGPISPQKMLWLSYAIAGWFIVPFFLWIDPSLDRRVRRIFGAFLAAFVARGAIEMVLLYSIKHWSPLYGIAHDLFCIGLLVVMARGAPLPDVRSARARRYSASLIVGLIAEITFAGMFLQTGAAQQGIYFASTESQWWF
ncbi:MAG: hypothetical protein Q8S13_10960, partial [Dehalococcoidia bacterium]|nr:hypothetical protein [Dehalococcoidia bacterium]